MDSPSRPHCLSFLRPRSKRRLWCGKAVDDLLGCRYGLVLPLRSHKYFYTNFARVKDKRTHEEKMGWHNYPVGKCYSTDVVGGAGSIWISDGVSLANFTY